MATPLYRHTIYALTLLPETKQVVHKVKTSDAIMFRLGIMFTKEEYYMVAEELNINPVTARTSFHKLIKERKIEEIDSGSYYKVCVWEKNPGNAEREHFRQKVS